MKKKKVTENPSLSRNNVCEAFDLPDNGRKIKPKSDTKESAERS